MKPTVIRALAAALALAACAPSAPTREGAAVPPPVTCDAGLYAYLRGEPIAVVDTLNTGLEVRVLGPDEFVPRDFDPNRLTITENREGEVSRVFCG